MALPLIGRLLLFTALPIVANMLRKEAARRRLSDPLSSTARAMETAAFGLGAADYLRSWRGGARRWVVKAAQAGAIDFVSKQWTRRRGRPPGSS